MARSLPCSPRSALFALALLAATVTSCEKDSPTASPTDATKSAPGEPSVDAAPRTGPAMACEGNCVVDYSVMDLGLQADEGQLSAAVAACEANHAGDARCDSTTFQAARDTAICQVCKKEVDVEKDGYTITLEYKEKFGQIFWVLRSAARDGSQVIHWVGAADAVYKGPWTLPEGQDP